MPQVAPSFKSSARNLMYYFGCVSQGIAVALKCGATKEQFDSTVSSLSDHSVVGLRFNNLALQFKTYV